ncbi:TetR/AcrR family transcriptional regulator [Hufsiella ginkgonis]|uniref:TetR family transcriptional regulator n=1 Tax=Hufsiella ginkgonis TaxID=2695274 RepID=A0A7K1XTT8_9SPHI|nr:TetR/AcrR family transcriptional regulator [Hufsiella ginkgonis]MXV14228.1 TetR family transcriptional regulator [Hufsiella ginkgonis]
MRNRDDQKEQAIREKVIELTAQEGFDGLSMHKLARAAGVSPATIYIYFKDREDMLLQVFTEVSDQMYKATIESFDPDMPFAEGLRVQWINRAHYFINHPMEMQFLEQMRHSPLNEKAMAQNASMFKESMQKFVHQAIDRKELIQLPFEVYWSIAFAPMYQLVKYHAQGNSSASERFELTENILEQALRLVIKALTP